MVENTIEYNDFHWTKINTLNTNINIKIYVLM